MTLDNFDEPPGSAAPIRPAPDPLADEPTVLLQGALAEAWPEASVAGGLRDRLARRAAHSAQRMGAMVNVRRQERVLLAQSAQCTVQRIYRRDDATELRPGEPWQVRTIELAPQAAWRLPEGEPGLGRDWLLVRGRAQLQTEGEAGVVLQPLDYHVQGLPASRKAAEVQAGDEGAVLLLRERVLGAGEHSAEPRSTTSRETPDAWEDYAPLVKRRVLWRQGPMAAMLWLASPGATVPQHRHGHDEECLMLRGDLFQDDYLLREGDYQLAPCGSAHESVNTDTGALIYAHGDLEMQITGD
ncbi:MAG TPA: cupin domain-containing protein [Ideonella sp.]|uniref:cupin domain-containing protein n=1 Tax=Ideonella sp. TaxID=1929293 RepID=UPI002E3223B4|nr:cupin domain-containing protein [Ideonella sp.]HEX5687561.1 cupin domain-containing protein [Ideonella sp.]